MGILIEGIALLSDRTAADQPVQGADQFCDGYFADAEIVEDSDAASSYNDADAALIIRHCTHTAIERARWLVSECALSPDLIR